MEAGLLLRLKPLALHRGHFWEELNAEGKENKAKGFPEGRGEGECGSHFSFFLVNCVMLLAGVGWASSSLREDNRK